MSASMRGGFEAGEALCVKDAKASGFIRSAVRLWGLEKTA